MTETTGLGRRKPRTAIILGVLVAATATARANIPIEVYWGPRPEGAISVIGRVGNTTSNLGAWFTWPLSVAGNEGIERVPIPQDSITGEKIVSQYQYGYRQFQHFGSDALTVLAEAEQTAEEHGPAVAVLDNLQKTRSDALVSLAQGQKANGDEASAIDTMSELIQIYPDQTVNTPEYTTDQANLFGKARAAAVKAGSGILRINAPGCEVYVDEVHRGHDEIEIVETPGRYRVLCRRDDRWWRYDVEVRAGKTATLNLAWQLQDSLVWSKEWFGLQLAAHDPNELERYQELADLFGGTETLALVTLQSNASGVFVAVRLYDPKTKRITQQVGTQLGTDDDVARIAAIATFAATGAMSPYLEQLPAEPGPPRLHAHATAHVYANARSLSLLVGGGALAIGGLAMTVVGHPQRNDNATALSNLRIPGALLLNVGGAAAGLGAYYLFRKHDRWWPVALGTAIAVGLAPVAAYYIHVDNRQACLPPSDYHSTLPYECSYLNGTAWAGWPFAGLAAAGAGVALGFGIYNATHPPSPKRRDAWVPSTAAIVPVPGGAFVTLGGKF